MATTESICDYLRIDRAFVISLAGAKPELVSRVGVILIWTKQAS